MNFLGFIDYKKPIGDQIDYRTTSYMGHINQNDTMLGNTSHPRIRESLVLQNASLCPRWWLSDYKMNYVWKFNDPDEIRNPALGTNTEYARDYVDTKLRETTGFIAPRISISHESYVRHPVQKQEPRITKPLLESAVAAKKICIDRSKEGFTKYLDPGATTSNLAYVAYTPKELDGGIAAHDNITYWTWIKTHHPTRRVFFEKDPALCTDAPSVLCTKRRKEYSSTVKPVPHSGMITETRQNYKDPYNRCQNIKEPKLCPKLVFTEHIPSPNKIESQMYGSKESTLKYV